MYRFLGLASILTEERTKAGCNFNYVSPNAWTSVPPCIAALAERSRECKKYYYPWQSKITADDVKKWENEMNNKSADVPTNSGAIPQPSDITSSTGTTKKIVSKTPNNDILDVSIGSESQCIYPNRKHLNVDDIIANPNIKNRYFIHMFFVMFLKQFMNLLIDITNIMIIII